MEKHPGRVTFVNGNTNEIIDEEDVATVPPSIAFVELDGKRYPVVRIVVFEDEDRRIIRQYGEDGTLLLSTVQIRAE